MTTTTGDARMLTDTLPTPAPTLGTIALDAPGLRSDPAIQQRAAMDPAKVAEYADLYRDGRDLGPLTLFLDPGEHCLWLADGFHRLAAAHQAGLSSLPATFHPGDKRAALLYAVGANATHGLPRTHADKRKAVLTLLHDAEWSRWSDRELARRAGVSQPFVGEMRRSLITAISEKGDEEAGQPTTRQYTTRHGTQATMHVDGIGRNGVARCGDCHRPLSDPESISRGIGPICACKAPGASWGPSAGSLFTDMSAPQPLGAAQVEEISPPEEPAPMPPAKGTPEWFVMKQRFAEVLAELYRLAAKYGIESVIQEVIAPCFARYGQPLPGAEAVPTASTPDEAPAAPAEPPAPAPDEAPVPPGRARPYGQIPAKVLAALQTHGTDGATAHTLGTDVGVPYGQVWTALERLTKQGKALKDGVTYRATKGEA